MQTNVRYLPLGYNQLTPAAATKLGQGLAGNAVPAGANVAIISVSGAAVRWRDDGVAPTASVGMAIAAGTMLEYSGDLNALQIIQQAPTATVDVNFYKLVG